MGERVIDIIAVLMMMPTAGIASAVSDLCARADRAMQVMGQS